MLPTPCFVFSDAHLGASPPAVEASLLAFLRHAKGRARSLIVNGDLFDFWFEWRAVMPRGAFRVLAALADLRESGCEVVWLAGNHDCWGGEILRQDVGVDYQLGPWRGTIGAWQSFVHHGDGYRGEADRGYLRVQRILRHPWAVRAFRWLHPDLASRLALGTSKTSRQHNVTDKGEGLRDAAFARLASSRDDLVIFGHSHAGGVYRAPSGGVYANPGAWIDGPVYLRIDESKISLVRFDGSAEGHRLDALDRIAEKALGQP